MAEDRDAPADAGPVGAGAARSHSGGAAPDLLPGTGWPAADTLDGLGHTPFTPTPADWDPSYGAEEMFGAAPTLLPSRPDLAPARAAWTEKPRRPVRPRRTTAARPLRPPALGLPVIVLMALFGAFFGWVSGDPFWLALGAGAPGTVTVTSCESGVWGTRCAGTFVADDRSVTATNVYVSGLDQDERRAGRTTPARVLDTPGGFAYAASDLVLHVRWLLGLAFAAGCGLAAAAASGVGRLRHESPARRTMAWGLAVGGPVALFLGMLAAALLF